MVRSKHLTDGTYICIDMNNFWSPSRASLEGQASGTTAPFMCFGAVSEPFSVSQGAEIKQIKGPGDPQQPVEMVNSLQVLRKLN